MGKDALAQAVREDTELLEHFGLKLLSVEGGVNAAVEDELDDKGTVHPWNIIEIDGKLWKWLRPHLVASREAQCLDPLALMGAAAK